MKNSLLRHDYGARYYDAQLATWHVQDPKAEKYYALTPYSYVAGNPVIMIDPDGRELWKPIVKNGEVSYIAEEGDNLETFAEQYNLEKEQAKAIFKKSGITTVQAGTKISGDVVKKVTGSEVLRLNLTSKLATEQRAFDQLIFAMDYTRAKGEYGFYSTDFFANVFKQAYGQKQLQEAKWNLNNENIKIIYNLPLYETILSDWTSYAYFISNTPTTSKGGAYQYKTSIIFDVYLTFGKNSKNPDNLKYQGYLYFTTHRKYEDLIWKHFKN